MKPMSSVWIIQQAMKRRREQGAADYYTQPVTLGARNDRASLDRVQFFIWLCIMGFVAGIVVYGCAS